MPRNVLAIGISSYPPRIYASTKDQVHIFKVEPNADETCILQAVYNVGKIRFQEGLLILCSESGVFGFSFQENVETWKPEFHLKGKAIFDGLLVRQTELLVLSIEDEILGWQMHNYKELIAEYHIKDNVRIFQPQYHWSIEEHEASLQSVLDISSEGLCLISSIKSDIYVLDLIGKSDNPAPGCPENHGDNNDGGYGCFLQPCGIKGHQPPFLFCGSKNLEWAISQKRNITMENEIAPGDHRREKYRYILGWQSNEKVDNSIDPVFPYCHRYSSGVAFIWNNEESPYSSAVILLDYTENAGNCRFYKGSDYTDGYYKLESPSK